MSSPPPTMVDDTKPAEPTNNLAKRDYKKVKSVVQTDHVLQLTTKNFDDIKCMINKSDMDVCIKQIDGEMHFTKTSSGAKSKIGKLNIGKPASEKNMEFILNMGLELMRRPSYDLTTRNGDNDEILLFDYSHKVCISRNPQKIGMLQIHVTDLKNIYKNIIEYYTCNATSVVLDFVA